MKILKFLSGGTPTYQSITDPFKAPRNLASALTATSNGKESGLISDDLIKKLYETGIPSDVDNFLEKVSDLEYRQSLGLPISSGTIRKLEALGNRVIQQAKYLKNAEEAAAKNDALGEIAVGSRGELFVADKEKGVKLVSLSEFDAEKMTALTVGEILEARKFSSSQAWNESIIPVAGRNVGMSKINDYILNIIKTVGQTSSTSEAYTDLAGYIGREAAKKPNESQLLQLQSLAQMMNLVGADAIFKNRLIMSSKNMQEALSYIQSVLPVDMKRLLISRSVANGNSYEASVNNITQLIALACATGNDIKLENYLDYDDSANKAAGTLAGKQYDQKRNLTSLEILIQGSLNKTDYDIVSSKNPSVGMTLHGNSVGALTNYDNNVVPKAPISTAIESSIGPLVDKNHVTMGSLKISESMFDTIMYDGNDVLNVWAPVDSNGDIDLSGMKVFNELLDHFESDPSLSIQDKNNMLKYYGIQGYIDLNGQFVGTGNMALFLVFTGITSDEVISKEDDFVDILSDDKKKFELEQIERVYGYLNGKNKNKHSKYEFKKGWFDWSTDIIKAPVFMKLKNSALTQVGAFSNHGPLINTPTYLDNLAQDQMRYNRQHQLVQITLPSSNILFLE